MTVEARAGALREFYRALRPGGVTVITMDVPPSPLELVEEALSAGFELLGPLDTRLPASALYSEHYRLHVFRVALRRPSHLAKESP
jgi:SAM-dependent methyltransferase